MFTPATDDTADPDSDVAQIDVELVYAGPEDVWRHALQLAPCSTVHDALRLSRFFELFPCHSAATIQLGIYGQQCGLERQLNHQDRIEIYRPLVFDPMESRRRRAHHRQRIKQ